MAGVGPRAAGIRSGGASALDLDQELDDALAFNSVLSLPFALEGLVPRFAAATDGDPATEATL